MGDGDVCPRPSGAVQRPSRGLPVPSAPSLGFSEDHGAGHLGPHRWPPPVVAITCQSASLPNQPASCPRCPERHLQSRPPLPGDAVCSLPFHWAVCLLGLGVSFEMPLL